MVINKPDFSKPEEELGQSKIEPFGMLTRLFVGIICSVVIFGCLGAAFLHFVSPSTFPSPRDLELSTYLLLFGGAMAIVVIPWERFGLRVSKFAGVEFAQLIDTQAKEQTEIVSDFEQRIAFLEDAVHLDTESFYTMVWSVSEKQTERLLERFFSEYPMAFSPLRIEKWGAKQEGFDELGNMQPQLLRMTLRKMVREGKLATSVSRHGNTLFKPASLVDAFS
ncbi:hypothetical protein LRP50_24395 [Enterovibrio sp. ZSDZ42]|uniref:Uncharacterized protein n=1 Tax=Enterovibrio gelatinilyticus TaxID=2899819 RepID=A0ABT5R7M5_9GAMM|nr:hypothetical protein [Enterovibrio sp. ZSDZ42]MDD1796265.1 hypothetical protein [Enterovibrio sp. ZSDZ42]